MEHRRVCFCMLSLLPLVQISKLSQANSLLFGKVCYQSHPSRGAWIEIPLWQNKTVDEIVAPLAGCVD